MKGVAAAERGVVEGGALGKHRSKYNSHFAGMWEVKKGTRPTRERRRMERNRL